MTSLVPTHIKIGVVYVLYRISLDIIYLFWVSPIFAYSGLTLDINLFKLIFSYLILLSLIPFISRRATKVSHLVLRLHLIIIIVPMTCVFAMADLSSSFMIMIIVCFLVQLVISNSFPLIKMKSLGNLRRFVVSVLIFISIITYGYLFATQPVNLSAFNFSKIYELRSSLEISNGLMEYLITWQYRIITPLFLVIFYLRNNKAGVLCSVSLQLLMFMIYPRKEVLLSIILIYTMLMISKMKIRFDTFFIRTLIVISFAFGLIYQFFGNLMAFAVVPVRLLYIPAMIKFQHYDFFSLHPKLYYSEGVLGKILGIEYPYGIPSGMLVSGSNNNANTGYLAYAFDNAGFLGMIVITLIFSLILLLIDSMVVNENKNIIFSLLIYPMVILNDGDLLTLILTGGLFILLIFLFVKGKSISHKDIALKVAS